MKKAKINKIKEQLKRLHSLFSWRKISQEFYDGKVKFGTLQRFATDPGYMPRRREILEALCLVEQKNPPTKPTTHETRIKRAVARMAKDTRRALAQKGNK